MPTARPSIEARAGVVDGQVEEPGGDGDAQQPAPTPTGAVSRVMPAGDQRAVGDAQDEQGDQHADRLAARRWPAVAVTRLPGTSAVRPAAPGAVDGGEQRRRAAASVTSPLRRPVGDRAVGGRPVGANGRRGRGQRIGRRRRPRQCPQPGDQVADGGRAGRRR